MTKNWKLPQLVGSGTPAGSAFDAHTPVSEGAVGVVVVALVVGAVGEITLVLCSKPHAAVIIATAASAAAPNPAVPVVTLVITNLLWHAQSCASGKPDCLIYRVKSEPHQRLVQIPGHELVQGCKSGVQERTVEFSNTAQLDAVTGCR